MATSLLFWQRIGVSRNNDIWESIRWLWAFQIRLLGDSTRCLDEDDPCNLLLRVSVSRWSKMLKVGLHRHVWIYDMSVRKSLTKGFVLVIPLICRPWLRWVTPTARFIQSPSSPGPLSLSLSLSAYVTHIDSPNSPDWINQRTSTFFSFWVRSVSGWVSVLTETSWFKSKICNHKVEIWRINERIFVSV